MTTGWFVGNMSGNLIFFEYTWQQQLHIQYIIYTFAYTIYHDFHLTTTMLQVVKSNNQKCALRIAFQGFSPRKNHQYPLETISNHWFLVITISNIMVNH